MGAVRLSCPHCGFFKDMPEQSLPKGAFKVSCPKCRKNWVHGQTAPVARPDAGLVEPPIQESVQQVTTSPPPELPQEEPQAAQSEPPVERIACPGCGFFRDVAVGFVRQGARLSCPKCEQVWHHGQPDAVPVQPVVVSKSERITCPHCGFFKDIKVGAVPDGKTLACPDCRKSFVKGGVVVPAAPVCAAETAAPQQKPPVAEKSPFQLELPPELRKSCPLMADPIPSDAPPVDATVYDESGAGVSGIAELARKLAAEVPHVEQTGPTIGFEGGRPEQVKFKLHRGDEVKEASVQSAPAAPPTGDVHLASIGELFGMAWERYKQSALTFLAIYAITAILAAVAAGVPAGSGMMLGMALRSGSDGAAGVGLGILLAFLVCNWGTAALVLAAASQDRTALNALKYSKGMIWAFTWLFLVESQLIFGGFLLFIVPGILFMFWFFAAPFILAEEGEGGLDALLRSREYVRGHMGAVVARLLPVYFIWILCNVIPIIGPILGLLFMPFMMIYIYLVYEQLRVDNLAIDYVATLGAKVRLVALGSVGFIVMPVVGLAMLAASGGGSVSMSDLTALQGEVMKLAGGYGLPAAVNGGPAQSGDEKQLGDIYARYRKALDAGDIDELKKLLSAAKAADLNGPNAAAALGIAKDLIPANATVVSASISGDTGTLTLRGGEGPLAGEGAVRFIKERGDWRIDAENWKVSMGGAVNIGAAASATDDAAQEGPDESGGTTVTGIDGTSLTLHKSVYASGESITVDFTAPDSYAQDAWIGIIPAHIKHGSETENDNYDIAYQYLTKKTSGSLTFTAPPAPGRYEFRMNDTDGNGREVCSIGFDVVLQSELPPPPPPPSPKT